MSLTTIKQCNIASALSFKVGASLDNEYKVVIVKSDKKK